jgi:hypothetical protein
MTKLIISLLIMMTHIITILPVRLFNQIVSFTFLLLKVKSFMSKIGCN